MTRFAAVLALALSIGLFITACDSGPRGTEASPEQSVEALTTANQGAGQNPQSCENVKGTGFISGSQVPDQNSNVTASGPVKGDVQGTLTLVRDADATVQQDNGTTFATYHTAILDVDAPNSLTPKFTGTAQGNFNIGLGEEGRRSNRAIVRVNFDGPGSRHGSIKLSGPFDFSNFPPIIKANFKYNGRLCPEN